MIRKIRTCPKCYSQILHCPECGKHFYHGTASACDMPECVKMNAPLDCKCGRVASADLTGVLDFDMELIPYRF